MPLRATPRRDITVNREALVRDLRRAWRESAAQPGETMVSVRELSARYGLTLRSVSQELQKLSEEGVLYTIPRVGTFMGRPAAGSGPFFVAVFPGPTHENSHFAAVRSGFEERMAQLGASCLALDENSALTLQAEGALAGAGGIFEFQAAVEPARWALPGVPHVLHAQHRDPVQGTDTVNFDNVGGGRLATRHLLALGHRRIAFVGLHGQNGPIGVFSWSRERAEGWAATMADVGCDTHDLLIRPEQTPQRDMAAQSAAAYEQCRALLRQGGFTAVLTVNACAARGFIEAVRELNLAPHEWPAMLSFDTESFGTTDSAQHLLSALRLSWADLGREAANLLWERSHGRLGPEPVDRLVAFSLIPRFSCRPERLRPLTAEELMRPAASF